MNLKTTFVVYLNYDVGRRRKNERNEERLVSGEMEIKG